MSFHSSNGNLAPVHAHRDTHYSIVIRTARKCYYELTDDCVSDQKQFDAVSLIFFIPFRGAGLFLVLILSPA